MSLLYLIGYIFSSKVTCPASTIRRVYNIWKLYIPSIWGIDQPTLVLRTNLPSICSWWTFTEHMPDRLIHASRNFLLFLPTIIRRVNSCVRTSLYSVGDICPMKDRFHNIQISQAPPTNDFCSLIRALLYCCTNPFDLWKDAEMKSHLITFRLRFGYQSRIFFGIHWIYSLYDNPWMMPRPYDRLSKMFTDLIREESNGIRRNFYLIPSILLEVYLEHNLLYDLYFLSIDSLQ